MQGGIFKNTVIAQKSIEIFPHYDIFKKNHPLKTTGKGKIYVLQNKGQRCNLYTRMHYIGKTHLYVCKV